MNAKNNGKEILSKQIENKYKDYNEILLDGIIFH